MKDINVRIIGKDKTNNSKIYKKGQMSNKSDETDNGANIYDDVIEPEYCFSDLVNLVHMSNTLPQCIEAMAQNCEGFGYNLVLSVPEEEIKTLGGKIEEERERINKFFSYISYDMSFTELRKKIRRDRESIGNAFIEVLRSEDATIDGFEYLKGTTMRLGRLSKRIEVDFYRKEPGSLEYRKVKRLKRFRTFIQIIGTEKVYFKEFGDPRFIDSETGEEVTEEKQKEIEIEGKSITPATEVLFLPLDNVSGPYGVPRWTGNILSVSGSRATEEVNYTYFDNKAIPPMAVLVSGGELTEDSIAAMEEYVNEGIKGRENFHKMLLIQAEGTREPNSMERSNVKVEFKELSQIKDATHREYDRDNREKIRSSFRLPPIYLGLSDDYSHATAKQSKEVAEEQVFGPEKANFDFIINHKIFPELDVKYHRFETKSAPVDNRKDMSEIIKLLGDSGLTVNEARRLIDKIADIELDKIDPDQEGNEWMNVPMKLSQFMLALAYREAASKDGKDETKEDKAKKLASTFIQSLQEISKSIKQGTDEYSQ